MRHSATFTRKSGPAGQGASAGCFGIPFDRLRTGFNRHGRGIGALAGGAGVAPGLVRSRRAGAWIPVSGHGNDGARRAHGSMDSPPAPLAQHGSASLPHLNPRPLGRRLNGGGEGAWIPVSGHGNDSTRRLWLHGLAARATSAARERVAPPPHLNPPPLGRRPNGGEEGAWIPVSGHGNDGARRAHGSMDSPPAPLAQHGSASLPHLNPRPLGRRLNGGGEGAWIPVSGHGNDSTRRLWLHGLAARATSAARERVAPPPPTSILPLWGGGQTAARKGHGFPCRGTGMTERGGEEASGGGKGAWIPVSGHGNDGTRRGGGQTAARKGHGFPCRGTGMTEREGEEAKQ